MKEEDDKGDVARVGMMMRVIGKMKSKERRKKGMRE